MPASEKQLSEEDRNELLTKLAGRIEDNIPKGIASSFTTYAKRETDTDVFRQVFDETHKSTANTAFLYRQAFGKMITEDRLMIPEAHLLIIAEKMFADLPSLEVEGGTWAEMMKNFAAAARENSALANFTVKNLDAVLQRIEDPAHKASIPLILADLDNEDYKPDSLSKFATERAVKFAKDIEYKDQRLRFCSAGLRYTSADTATKNTARHVFQKALGEAQHSNQITHIVEYAEGFDGKMDPEIDEAAAERWQAVTAGLDRNQKLTAANEITGGPNGPRLQATAGKLLKTAYETIISIAEQEIKGGKPSQWIKDLLEDIAGKGNDNAYADVKKAQQLLNKLEPAKTAKSASPSEFFKIKK